MLTRSSHESSATLRDSVASVRRAREAEIGLIRHQRARDPVTRHALEANSASRPFARDRRAAIGDVGREWDERNARGRQEIGV